MLRAVFSNDARAPRLTDEELAKVRHMLDMFDAVCGQCPVGRHVSGKCP